MSNAFLYASIGAGLFSLGLYALIIHAHLLRKILAINVMGSGVFLVLVALANRTGDKMPDPVPHAMVITGIVVAVVGRKEAARRCDHAHQHNGDRCGGSRRAKHRLIGARVQPQR